MYKPVAQNPPGMLDQGEQKEHNCVFHFFCWFFQIAVWVGIGVDLYLIIQYGSDNIEIGAGGLGFAYLVYLILEFCSPTSRYLCNKSSDQGMYVKMGTHFRTPPEIKFHGECYHYEKHHYTTRDKDGHVHHHTRTVRVVTHTEIYSLPYYSERDVSGLFYLNCDRAQLERKHYIKLELKEEINFADAISYMDYESQKYAFWRRNRFRDVHFDFRETRTIPGMAHHNLVKMTAREPCTVNYFFFFLFTILTFSEFYKIYVNSFCVYQKFKVRKLVSTRYDLNQDVYQTFVPQLNLITQEYQYQSEYYNYLNNQYHVELPTQEELERAKQYQNKVPDYQLSSGGGQIQAGVIVDNPGYSSFEANKPPAGFEAVSGNVALSNDQVNSAGNAPSNFDQPNFEFKIAPAEDPNAPPQQTYQPLQPQPGYAPQQPPQGYEPQQPPQGYAPQQPPQGYAPQQPPQGYQGYPPQQNQQQGYGFSGGYQPPST